MAEQTSMNLVIHAALRRTLDRFTDAFETFPDGDAARARALGVAWRHFHDEYTRHHTSEHKIAWPAMRAVGVSSELLDELDAEHDKIGEALSACSTAMAALEASPTSASAATALDAIRNLREVSDRHLAHEESEIEPVYQDKHDAPQIRAMGRQFRREYPPAAAGTFMAWLQDGATAQERAALRRNIPAPVVTVFTGILGRGYRRNIAPVWQA